MLLLSMGSNIFCIGVMGLFLLYPLDGADEVDADGDDDDVCTDGGGGASITEFRRRELFSTTTGAISISDSVCCP